MSLDLKAWCNHYDVVIGKAEATQYFQVRVFDSKRGFRVAARAFGMDARDAAACCHTYTIEQYKKGAKGPVVSPDVGTILLVRGFTAEEVSHECCHAAFHWARLNKTNPTRPLRKEDYAPGSGSTLSWDSPEEQYCFVQGGLVQQIVNHIATNPKNQK